eukprot:gene23878-9450_t
MGRSRMSFDCLLECIGSTIFVSDTGNNCIQKVDKKGRVSVFAGVCGATTQGTADGLGAEARFNTPFGIDVDQEGNLYVADSGNNCIRKIAPCGLVSTFSGVCNPLKGMSVVDGDSMTVTFYSLQYLAVDPVSQELYVTEGSACMRKVARDGSVTTESIGRCTANAVQSWKQRGDVLYDLLSGVAMGPGRMRYFTDDNCVRTAAWDAETSTLLAGSCNQNGYKDGNGLDARFNAAIGLRVDAEENVYLADMGNNCIRKVNRKGVVSTIAGTCGTQFNGTADGVGSEARFQGPWDVAPIGRKGALIVADSDNSCIRKVKADGTVTTLAGVCGWRKDLGEFRYPRGIVVY